MSDYGPVLFVVAVVKGVTVILLNRALVIVDSFCDNGISLLGTRLQNFAPTAFCWMNNLKE